MSIRRGDVVVVDWPLFRPAVSQAAKARPAVVIQNDKDNGRLTNTILAMVTSVTHRRLEPTQFLIEIGTPDGKLTGLRQDSVVNCVNLLTVEQAKILVTIGMLPAPFVQKLNDCLKVALELP
jgi:mRNA-degrading endonuclease toxin of MazEF toxin-antitoxin module